MRISHGARGISQFRSSSNSWIYFSSRENTILRSKLAPRVGASVGDIGNPSDDDDDDDDDDASSVGRQDHERVINHKFGLDPGRIYVIPNAVVTDKFKPYPQKKTNKGVN